jgi:4-amino-4-deoxy-L-arabinose transferase-like glycosyltransferase
LASSSTQADGDRARGRELALLALALLGLAALRLARLDADPLPLLAPDFLSDEGWWAHNARNHALFGRWILDDHNPPLFGAPLWTLALAASYALFDVGIAATRLPSALAGLVTCALVFALLRRTAGVKAGLLGALLLGLDPFVLAHHRSAFVETYMVAWITACFVALERARGRLWPAALAGALFSLAVLAKLWAIGTAFGVLAFWGLRWLHARARHERFELREPLGFALGAGAVAGAVGLVFVLPHLAAVRHGLAVHAHRAVLENPLLSIGALGLAVDERGVSASGFVWGTGWLVVTLAVLLARAILVRASWLGERSAQLCLAWLAGGVLQVAWQGYQPDRRWLVLGPPLAALVALAWARGAASLPTREELRNASRGRRSAALVLVAAAIGLVLREPLVVALVGALPDVNATPLERAAIGGAIAWGIATPLACAAAAFAARPLADRLTPRLCHGVVAGILALQALAGAAAILRLPTTVRDASRALAAATRDWPESHKRIVGGSADTLALETDLFAFVVRDSPLPGARMNLDGWQRFEPWIAVDVAPAQDGFRRLPDLEIGAGARTRPVPIWVREAAADEVAAALVTPPD